MTVHPRHYTVKKVGPILGLGTRFRYEGQVRVTSKSLGHRAKVSGGLVGVRRPRGVGYASQSSPF